MNVTLLLVTCFVLFAGTFYCSADLVGFQKQLAAILPFDISNKTLCKTPPCIGDLNPRWCFGFNTSMTQGAIDMILNSTIGCYMNGFCNATFANRTLKDVNITLPAPAGYDGECYLYGSQVSFVINPTKADTKYLDTRSVSYIVYHAFTYTFTGLSVLCQPCCDCGCSSGPSVGKREAPEIEMALSERQAAPENKTFESAVSAVLSVTYNGCYLFRAGSLGPFVGDGSNRASTNVSLGSGVPSQYQADLTASIQAVFNDYNVFYYLTYYYNAIIQDLVLSFYRTCPGHK